MITFARLEAVLATFSRLTIGLIGDLFLDRYLEIEPGVAELSLETGLEAYQITQVRNQPGALGTVINNLAALGVGRIVPATVIGNDGHGFDLLRSLASLPVDAQHILQRDDRLTPTYTKPLRRSADGSVEELNRLDVRDRRPLTPEATRLIVERLERLFVETDGLIVLDQINETDWGVVNATVRDALCRLTERYPEKLVFVDSRTHLHAFRCGILKGNRTELGALRPDRSSLEGAMQDVSRLTRRSVYCTMGEEGMLVAMRGVGDPPDSEATVRHVAGIRVEGPIDIVGAGDSATAGIVAGLLAGATPIEAAALANLVASITVQKLGTTGTAAPEEVLRRHQEATSRGWPHGTTP